MEYWPFWRGSLLGVIVSIIVYLVLSIAAFRAIDWCIARRRGVRREYGFWGQYLSWYGMPSLSSYKARVGSVDVDDESRDFRMWFDQDELAECPKCGHTAARVSDAGALYCPACGIVSPSEAEWKPVPCPHCGAEAFPVNKAGALYCSVCGQITQQS